MKTFFSQDSIIKVTMQEHRVKRASQAKEFEESFFKTPTFQALTIGVPFCIFKLLFGALSIRIGGEQMSGSLVTLGWLIAAWALIDLLMNLARVFFHLTGQASPIEYCTIAQIGRYFKSPGLFLAIDTFISFSIICIALWSGWIARLSREESYLWYMATTLNLISISVVNVWLEFRRSHGLESSQAGTTQEPKL
jgi:hypothetical protein